MKQSTMIAIAIGVAALAGGGFLLHKRGFFSSGGRGAGTGTIVIRDDAGDIPQLPTQTTNPNSGRGGSGSVAGRAIEAGESVVNNLIDSFL